MGNVKTGLVVVQGNRNAQRCVNLLNVNVLPWPALSPDMNPIEHIYDELGRRSRTNN